MHFFTTIPESCEDWIAHISQKLAAMWEFGAPGHGKGVWDGVAAWMKRTVRQAIIDCACATSSGLILVPSDVAEHLKATFETDQFVADHVNKVVQKVVVTYVDAQQIQRPVVRHKFAQMPGIKKTFQFLAVRESVLLQKSFPCWCHACFHASGTGQGIALQNG